MGNKLCKKRVDGTEKPKEKSLNRIFNKFSVKQKSKSETNLDNQNNKSKKVNESISKAPTYANSTDWTEISLEVPDDAGNVKQIQKTNEANPVPPPRKKKGLKEKLESVSFLQAFTTSDKPIEEPICVKKTINTVCPCCNGRRDLHEKNALNKAISQKRSSSVSSLPTVNNYKLSLAEGSELSDFDRNSSVQSLPDESKKSSAKSSDDKLDSYLTRARSFGSLLPTMLLHKISAKKAPLAEIESDDSLAMEDWGLNMIEHYKPKDSSLPRNTRRSLITDDELLLSIKDQLVEELPPNQNEIQKKNLEPVSSKIEESKESSLLIKENNSPSSACIVGANLKEEPIEHSKLIKILEQYSDKKGNVMDSKNINDFLNAERSNGFNELKIGD